MVKTKLQITTCMAVICVVLVGTLPASPQSPATSSDTEIQSASGRAGVAAAAVQRFYDPATGLFCSGAGDCWWWSANELTALIDYGRQAKSTVAVADIANTYTAARYRGPQKDTLGPFIDTWTDDDGWWGLAWVDAYDYAKTYILRTPTAILHSPKASSLTWPPSGRPAIVAVGYGRTRNPPTPGTPLPTKCS